MSLLHLKRVPMRERSPEERVKDFREYLLGYSDEEAVVEASRCLGCGLCIDGCPARLNIPKYVMAIAKGNKKESLNVIFRSLPFPSICGRVCTHRCEYVCVLGKRGEPVAIRWIKRVAGDGFSDYHEAIEVKRAPDTGKKIALIGAGPASLTAAYYLALKGHRCVVFEALPVAGGMMRVGIPRYRLSAGVIDKEVDFIRSVGVEIKLNTRIGKDISFEKLREDYDAIFIGTGYHHGYLTNTKGTDNQGVFEAIEFLRRVNLGKKVSIGESVVVVGGGNTAIDAARVCIRLGAKVTILYRRREVDMPADPEEIHDARAEGVDLKTQTVPLEYLGRNGKLYAVKYAHTEMIDQGAGKRPKPRVIEGDEHVIEADSVIEAIGQGYELSFLPESMAKNSEFLDRKHIKVDSNGMTVIPGIFAGGDLTNDVADIVSAVADGKRAAEGIHRWLKKEEKNRKSG